MFCVTVMRWFDLDEIDLEEILKSVMLLFDPCSGNMDWMVLLEAN